MTNIGVLAFDLYNQDFKNELFLNTPEDYRQTQRAIIRNASASDKIIIKYDEQKKYHFALVFKKGLLPENIEEKISKWKSLEGSDIFDPTQLSKINAFNKDNFDEYFKVNTDPIVKVIEQAIKELIPSTQEFLGGVKNVLLRDNDLALYKEETEDWTKHYLELRDTYEKCLAILRNLASGNNAISNNPLMLNLLSTISEVFVDLDKINKTIKQIQTEINAFEGEIDKAKVEAINAAVDELGNQIIEAIAPYLGENITADKLFDEDFWDIKISQLFQLDKVELNEEFIRELEGVLSIEEAMPKGKWVINRVDIGEEVELQYTYRAEDETYPSLEIDPNGYIRLDLTIVGQMEGLARSVIVELRYPSAEFKDMNGKEIPIRDHFSQSILNLINYSLTGLSIPLTPLVSNGGQILNNGQYSNTTFLELKNETNKPLKLKKGCQLQLSFITQKEGETTAYALTEKDKVKNVKVEFEEKIDSTYSFDIPPDRSTFGEFLEKNIFESYQFTYVVRDSNDWQFGFFYLEIENTFHDFWVCRLSERTIEPPFHYSVYFFDKTDLAFNQLIEKPESEIKEYFAGQLIVTNNDEFSQNDGLGKWLVTGKFLTPSPQSTNPIYNYQIENDCEYSPGEGLGIKISNLKTGTPNGFAPITIRLIRPSIFYRDSLFSWEAEKVTYLSDYEKGIFNEGNTTDILKIKYPKIDLEGGSYSVSVDASNGFQIKDGNNSLFQIKDATSLYHQVLPIGTILMWHGMEYNIPIGWKSCNSKNSKLNSRIPDLSGRFIVGVSSKYPYKKAGGDKGITLTENELPAHTHKGSTFATDIEKKEVEGYDGGQYTLMNGAAYFKRLKDEEGGEHAYDAGDPPDKEPLKLKEVIHLSHKHDFITNLTGEGNSFEVIPPYYALYYIIRID